MTMWTALHRHTWVLVATLVGSRIPSIPVDARATIISRTPPAFADPRTAPVDSNTFDYTSGGVHVIQRLTPGNDVVALRLYLLGGVLQLTPSTAGLEELALRTLAYGSARYPGPASRRAFARTGSQWHENSGSDWSTVGFVSITDRFDSAWAVFGDRIAHPTLDSTSIALMRSRMIRELHSKDLSPERLAALLADSLGVDGHPYALHPYGSQASLEGLTPALVRQYVASQFVTLRMLLVVVGNVPQRHLDSLVAATFGTLPSGSYVRTAPPVLPSHHTIVISVARPTSTSYIAAWYAGPLMTDKDYPAFEIATSFLSSRLNTSIRQKNNLSYAAYATADDRAVASGGLYVSTGDPKTVLPMLLPIVDSLKMDVSPYQALYLGNLQQELKGSYLLEQETNEGQAVALGRAQILFGDYRQAAAELQRFRGVDLGTVITAARRYMHDLQFVYVGDTSHFRADWIRR